MNNSSKAITTCTQHQQHDRQHEGPAGQQRALQSRTSDDDEGWTTVPKLGRRGKAVYGKKQSDALKAPPRRYELVVFNVTRDHDVNSVKSYITSDGIDVLNIKALPTNSEFNDCLMFNLMYTIKTERQCLIVIFGQKT